MINSLLKSVSKLSTTKSLVIGLTLSASICVYLNAFVGVQLGGVPPLDAAMRGYTVAEAAARMKAHGETGRRVYYTFGTVPDMIFCAVYTIFLSAWLIRLYGYQRQSTIGNIVVKQIDLLPFVAGISDFIENWYFFAMTYYYPLSAKYNWLVPIFSTLTVVKWAAVFMLAAFIILGGFKHLLYDSNKNKQKLN